MPDRWFSFLIMFLLLLSSACQSDSVSSDRYQDMTIALKPMDAAKINQKIEKESFAEVANGLQLSLWASDSLTRDPIAISIDPEGGIYYTRAIRMQHSEFDIRGHREWMTKSISWQTVEDRRDFLHENFPEDGTGQNDKLEDLNADGQKDWRDLAVQKEEVWRITDESGDGYADLATRYLDDFNKEYTDVANGIEYADGHVYIGCAPDLWKTTDSNGDGKADEVESLASGFGIHIGFSGHGMSGVIMGPDGRLYWGIGDIGMNYTDKDGKQWKYPNQGVIVRCEPDGNNFEVFASGVRNTHEFVFDRFGNLISEDNDGDHRGERERLVYLIDGSDSGWRSNWQYGKYTDPKNNSYKVWVDEKMSIPAWEGQAAYFLPPIMNYVNGPTGFVYNPGTALGEEWKDHFFVSEFRGTPARSPIHAFTLKPEGASFKLDQTKEIVKGLLPTGLDFGPDGALYFADWIDGWDAKNLGRIWKLDVPGGANSESRQKVKELIQADFSIMQGAEIQALLSHPDMRIRQKAQFTLVNHEDGVMLLKEALEMNELMAKVHAIWGLGQLARKGKTSGALFIPLLEREEEEVVIQALRQIGDISYEAALDMVIPLILSDRPRIRLKATQTAGRIGSADAMSYIIQMLEQNNNKDIWLRHAGSIALARIGEVDALKALVDHPSKAVKTAAIVALRRLQSPAIEVFLSAKDEYLVTEAARAINDDFSILEAIPGLASLLPTTLYRNEPLVRRIINANLRIGKEDNLKALLDYATNAQAPALMRKEAVEVIATWDNPSVMDRVDGRFRGKMVRDSVKARTIIEPYLDKLLNVSSSEILMASMEVLGHFGYSEKVGKLASVYYKDKSADVKVKALKTLHILKYEELPELLEDAMNGSISSVKAAAINLISDTELSGGEAVSILTKAMQSKSIDIQQAAIHALADYEDVAAIESLSALVAKLSDGSLNPALELDLIEAIDGSAHSSLQEELNAAYAIDPDPLAKWASALEGGQRWQGSQIFNNHAGAQCTRCHTVFEVGGDAGPALADVGSRLDRRQILESLIMPGKVLAPGYGATTITLQNGKSITGIIMSDTEDRIVLKSGEESTEYDKSKITERKDIPSSMPPMKGVLTIRELRDVVAYLSSLKGGD